MRSWLSSPLSRFKRALLISSLQHHRVLKVNGLLAAKRNSSLAQELGLMLALSAAAVEFHEVHGGELRTALLGSIPDQAGQGYDTK